MFWTSKGTPLYPVIKKEQADPATYNTLPKVVISRWISEQTDHCIKDGGILCYKLLSLTDLSAYSKQETPNSRSYFSVAVILILKFWPINIWQSCKQTSVGRILLLETAEVPPIVVRLKIIVQEGSSTKVDSEILRGPSFVIIAVNALPSVYLKRQN